MIEMLEGPLKLLEHPIELLEYPLGLLEYPLVMSLLVGLGMAAAALIGIDVNRRRAADPDARDYRGLFVGSTLGLLSLVIGFTLSMSVARYDLRKAYEAQEANAIGTEYDRIDLLTGADQGKIKALMSNYLDERIRFYAARDKQELRQNAVRTEQLQTQMWSAVSAAGTAQPNPVAALAVAGMNEVLDDKDYAAAAWRNRLPMENYLLMAGLALLASGLIGFGAPKTMSRTAILTIMPAVISVAFFLIVDIDSPRTGFVHIAPYNLLDLAQSIRSPVATAPDATAAR
jgi:hypothetical protein